MSSLGDRITVNDRYKGDFVPLFIDYLGSDTNHIQQTGYDFPTFYTLFLVNQTY